MPRKKFFSHAEPEKENDLFGNDAGTEETAFRFDGSFGDMPPMDLFADESAAADDFAAMLQPDINAMQEQPAPVFGGEEAFPSFGEQPSGDFFGNQPEFGQEGFSGQPAAQEELFAQPQQDGFFDVQQGQVSAAVEETPPMASPSVAQPEDMFSELFSAQTQPVQADNAFFAPQDVQQDVLFSAQGAEFASQPDLFAVGVGQPEPEIFTPQSDGAIPVAAPVYETPAPGFAQGSVESPVVPFDIAEEPMLQQPVPNEAVSQERVLSPNDPDYVPKRKYKPVFTAPVPSALDELRAGIVRPASPITDVAATQVPVVITAVEAAAAETAARAAAQQATQQVQEEQAALENPAPYEAAPHSFAEQPTLSYEMPQAPQPTPAYEQTPAYEAPPEQIAYGYEGEIHPQTMPSEGAEPSLEGLAFAAQEPEQMDAPQANADFVQYEAPMQPQETVQQDGFSAFDAVPVQAQEPLDTPQEGYFTQEALQQPAPEQFAENLQAMLGADDGYQPQQPQEAQNLFEGDFGGDLFGDNLDMPTDDGFAAENAEDGVPFVDGAMQLPEEGDAQPSFNPFASKEWLGEEGDDDDADALTYDRDDDGGVPPRGRGPKKSSPVMLIVILSVLLVAIAGVVLFVLFGGKDRAPSSSVAPPNSVSTPSVSESVPPVVEPVVDPIPRDEWYMKLVNRSSVLPKEYAVKVAQVSGGIEVDERIVSALNQMLADAKTQGVNLKVVAGYRSYARQETSYKARVAEFLKQGKAQEEAEKLAAEITAAPGTSEHNLGLSADIQSTSSSNYADNFKDTAEAKWLKENAATYGFILRYPEGKEGTTGFVFEPWHYRYVGVDQAQRIVASGLTFEEYLAQEAPTGIPQAPSETPDADVSDSTAEPAAG